MRVLTVEPGPHFSVADVHNGWKTALANLGAQIGDYNMSNRLAFYSSAEWDGQRLAAQESIHLAISGVKGKCYEFWPDVIMVTSAFFIPDQMYDLWRQRPHKLVLLFTESPYEDDRQLDTVRKAEPDLVILNDPTNLDRFRDVCKNSHYFPHAYDPKIHYPRAPHPELVSDFAFLGTGYPSRVEFFEQCDWSGLDVKFAGNWNGADADCLLRDFLIHPAEECFDNAHAPTLYSSAKASANLYRAGRRPDLEANSPDLADGWAMGPREVELAACGTFFLREQRGEGDELFSMLPTFVDPDDFDQILRYYLSHDQARHNAAEQARAATADRTFDANARRMLQLLDI